MSEKHTLTGFRLPVAMLDDLKVYCEENDMPVSQVIRKSVRATLYGDRNVIYENNNSAEKIRPKTWSVR